ncbi:MAG: signal peptidase I [Acidimicrobiia bacterium]|nr:signal peptidase I [Acidimicrobiia bacterium]
MSATPTSGVSESDDALTSTQGLGEPDPPGSSGGRPGVVRTAIEWLVVVVGAVAVALLIKTYLLQAFYIPSTSMESVLQENDRVLVNKLAYRFGEIDRGDIIVFDKPDTDRSALGINDLIKRVVGLPGETLVIDGGNVLIDGEVLDEPYLDPGVETLPGTGTSDPRDPSAPTVNCTPQAPCVIPENHVFVMGDNRHNSKDSRYQDLGYIDLDTVAGRAVWRIWPPGRLGGL